MSDSGPTVTRLIDDGVLDAELTALIWQLSEGGVPLTISGPPGSSRRALAKALQDLGTAHRASKPQANGEDLLVLDAESLEEVFARMSAPPLSLLPDQLRALGLVLITRHVEGLGPRLVAAHYLRPVERDAAGHLQRRPPALLAAWDVKQDRLEHFAWGITTELAKRLSLSMPEFEDGQRSRRQLLERLVAAGVFDGESLRRALGEFLRGERH